MEGWGKELGKLSVLSLSEFILNFEEDYDFLPLLRLNHFMSRHWKRNVIIYDFLFLYCISICDFFSTAIYFSDVFIKEREENKKVFLQNEGWILFQNDWRQGPWLFGTIRGFNIDLTSPSQGVCAENSDHNTCPASLRRFL